ncbi:Zinc/iron permease [Westerdykella ornata]|uniref:Zinc/iron permease n=1 Tax=Westerdykella ornata TaxID=318751 RepID=A0A6A6JYK9_WESOR|nr:Zinc/iron permease [Westerdykella ornata]KAF2281314.1 Zinc/iron permease [Westerdykella ornata]
MPSNCCSAPHADATDVADRPDVAWSQIPSDLLYDELRRRLQAGEDAKPPCGGTKASAGYYNTEMHVFALFLILAVSFAACAFPVIVNRIPKLPVPHRFLFFSRHFGTGVLIATAFIHLLPTAFQSLTDPCLPSFWTTSYPAMPGLIAMTSVFVVVGIEMYFASKGAGHVHTADFEMDEVSRSIHSGHRSSRSFSLYKASTMSGDAETLVPDYTTEVDGNLVAGPSFSDPAASDADAAPLQPRMSQDGNDSDPDRHSDEVQLLSRPISPRAGGHRGSNPSGRNHSRSPSRYGRRSDIQWNDEKHDAAEEERRKRQLLQCLLLEAGILFHSVFIGMAVSVATGASFVVLLVAISFHQTFEGFALGARISAIKFPPRSPQPWLMCLAYGTTTPIGQAIGLAIHNAYDPESQTGLLAVGLMNAISSGLLLFAGLVELLAEDFLSEDSYRVLTGKKRIQACICVVGGAALMSLVGAWA